ncbi:hypothetical protein Taro_050772, partial [Colocasia esculenta]|nr:hypothetical protein [Colocasia esculenta]
YLLLLEKRGRLKSRRPKGRWLDDEAGAVELPTCKTTEASRWSETPMIKLAREVKKPTFWYKLQCGSARLKPPARFYTEYSLSVGQKSFLEKKEQS